ncbi:Putative inner membrane protein [Klebsiella pneumoniae IS39]|nr:Putative inner membrane protein [Klebsiella pneumoniae IS39]
MFLIILIKSLIIGGLVGVGVGAGAARMFHAPTTQGMGAFRTLGELNSCEGDPASHFSFGLGFFFNAWASSVAAGSFTQDVDHRIIPNWGAAALMLKNRNVGETLHDPKKNGHLLRHHRHDRRRLPQPDRLVRTGSAAGDRR